MHRYFLLWLDSYTQQYAAWKTHVLRTRTSKHHTHSWKPKQPSSASYSNNTNTNTYTSEGSGSVPKSFIATQGSHEMDLVASRKLKRVYTSAPPSKALAYHWHQAHRAFFPHLQSSKTHHSHSHLHPRSDLNSRSRAVSSRTQDHSSHLALLALRVDPVLFEPLLRIESSNDDNDSDTDGEEVRVGSKTSPSTGKNQHRHKTNKNTTKTRTRRRENPVRQIVGGAYPPPDAFLPLRRDVEARLRESAAAFVRASCSNSG